MKRGRLAGEEWWKQCDRVLQFRLTEVTCTKPHLFCHVGNLFG